MKRIRDEATEEPLTSSDDKEDVEESRKDTKHRRRKQLVKSINTVGKLIDEKMKGETELDKKTMKMVPKSSLVTKTYERYLEAKKDSPERYRNMFPLDHLERLHEMAMRRAGMVGSPTVKELIKLEEKKLGEKSVRTPTVKEILRDKPLGETEDVRKILPFAEGGDSEGEVGEEEVGGTGGRSRRGRRNGDIMKVRKRGQGHLYTSMLQQGGMTIYRGERRLRGGFSLRFLAPVGRFLAKKGVSLARNLVKRAGPKVMKTVPFYGSRSDEWKRREENIEKGTARKCQGNSFQFQGSVTR